MNSDGVLLLGICPALFGIVHKVAWSCLRQFLIYSHSRKTRGETNSAPPTATTTEKSQSWVFLKYFFPNFRKIQKLGKPFCSILFCITAHFCFSLKWFDKSLNSQFLLKS